MNAANVAPLTGVRLERIHLMKTCHKMMVLVTSILLPGFLAMRRAHASAARYYRWNDQDRESERRRQR